MGEFVLRVSRVLAWGSAFASAFVALALSADVTVRTIVGRGIFRGIDELSVLLLVIIAFGGLAQAEADGAHVRMTLVTSRVPERIRYGMQVGGHFATSVVVLVMAYATGVRALASYQAGEVQMGLMRFPIWPARIVIAVGSFWLCLVILTKAFKHLRLRKQPGMKGA